MEGSAGKAAGFERVGKLCCLGKGEADFGCRFCGRPSDCVRDERLGAIAEDGRNQQLES